MSSSYAACTIQRLSMLGLWEGQLYDCHKDIKLVKAQILRIGGTNKILTLPLPVALSLPNGVLVYTWTDQQACLPLYSRGWQ